METVVVTTITILVAVIVSTNKIIKEIDPFNFLQMKSKMKTIIEKI